MDYVLRGHWRCTHRVSIHWEHCVSGCCRHLERGPKMKAEHTQEPRGNVAYLMFILGVSVVAVILMIVEAVAPLTPGTRAILDYSDTALCAVFFIDFLITLASTSKKLRYLRSWGVLDLVSCVPMLSAFRVGRLARVVRILRLLRGVRSARILASALMKHRAQSTFSLAALVSILLLVFGSIAMLQFEDTPQGNIKGPEDAIWWSVVTLTTVGYGDRFPVTSEGRLVAVILMLAGVGLFGTLSGFLATWFLAPASREKESDSAALRVEIQRLREAIEESRNPSKGPRDHSDAISD